MSNRVALVLFLILVVGGGALIGTVSTPGPWYEALAKPSFNPPNWVFAPVWTLLYVLIAIAGWLAWRQDSAGSLIKIWLVQMVLNFAWSPAFFVAHNIGLALAIILALLVSIAAFVALGWNRQRTAACLFLPYFAWVGFASLLNFSLFILN
jgi:benzodiazapine receptor